MIGVKIELQGYGYLDVSDQVPLSLMFNINDVRNISSRSGAWSKTIKIPGNANNNNMLGPLFDVNVNTLTFNPRHKETVIITVEGLQTFEGVMQVVKIRKNIGNSDIKVIYDIHIKSDTSNFYSDISGKLLTDLDLSQYDHNINEATVVASMNNGTFLDGYQYFLTYNPNEFAAYYHRDLIPGVYAKIYWDKIFESAGYIYEWDEEFDLNFDKLIIPSNSGAYKPFDDERFKFRAGFLNQHVLNTRNIVYNMPSPGAIETAFLPIINIDTDNYAPENWFDNDNRYNTNNNGRYDVSGLGGTIEFTLKFQAKIILNLIGPASANITASGFTSQFDPETFLTANYRIVHEVVLLDSMGAFLSNLSTNAITEVALQGPYISSANIIETLDYETSFVYDSEVTPGAMIFNQIRVVKLSNQTPDEEGSVLKFTGFKDLVSNNTYTGQLRVVIDPQSSSTGLYFNTPDNYTTIDSPIYINKLIPKETKQSDFIDAFVKMYNLYITEDPDNKTKLIIKTRDKFYLDGIELNWTDKLNSDSVDVELISNSQKKRKVFSYKDDDKDVALTAYKKQSNKVFGQLEYVFDNEFIQAIDRVEPLFAPTVIIDSGHKSVLDLHTPFIDSRNPTGKIRVLYAGDSLFGYWSFYYVTDNPKSSYRYAGHLYPDPIDPSEDLNFGVCDYYAHSFNQLTNNNLFNRFYHKQMNIFESGYLMTAYFDLDHSDIATLKLNERIFVYDSWWNVNKIIDFDVISRNMTKVELVTADVVAPSFIATPISVSSGMSVFTGPIQNHNDSKRNVLGSGVSGIMVTGDGNLIQPGSTNVTIIGNSNYTKGSNSIIVGKNNRSEGGDNLVSGDKNLVVGSKSVSIGGTNNTLLGENSVLIGGSGQVLRGDNIVKIGGVFLSGTNVVDSGRDTILPKYPTGKLINFISAGRDQVRPYGSMSIESTLNGGRDTV